ncbi:MAG: FAD/NAD(P)-binding protein [Planctomycetales bacterium]|nr:FAD/NAD(P)-binding protein [Planctomycetales bacterium]
MSILVTERDRSSHSLSFAESRSLPGSPATPPALRLAIVGCGPRGLQCMESLLRIVEVAERGCWEITVFEPAAYPGAGNVYDPRQPHYLKMNFASQHIDLWQPGTGRRQPGRKCLIDWLKRRYPQLAHVDGFIPRAIVGEYLFDCFHILRRELAERVPLTIIREKVCSLRPAGGMWRVSTATQTHTFDEVALCTGHEGFRGSSRLGAADTGNAEQGGDPMDATQGCVPRHPVFPVEHNLSIDKVPAGSRVLIRGFGLTAIDAVLALTEGRGGNFATTSVMPKYGASGREPSVIYLSSRTGRPLLAKATGQLDSIAAEFWHPFRTRLQRLRHRRGSLRLQGDLWPVLSEAAAGLLTEVQQSVRPSDIDEWYRGWSRYRLRGAAAAQAMLQSYAVAIGARSLDIPAALAESWRQLYPQWVALLGAGGLADDQWPHYRRLAAEMERIACGPPAANMGKLLALLRTRQVVIADCDAPAPECDHSVHAVIAGPDEWAATGPLQQLLQAQCVCRDAASGGLQVGSDGRPISPDGKTCQGLAVFGRATEGWIIGNDTLNRQLHGEIERWAASLPTATVAKLDTTRSLTTMSTTVSTPSTMRPERMRPESPSSTALTANISTLFSQGGVDAVYPPL